MLTLLSDPYVPRNRSIVLAVTLLMPLVVATPVLATVWRARAGLSSLFVSAVWLILPVFWTAKILALLRQRQRQGHPADEQTLLLYRVAMVIPVIGYVPMLWMLQ